MERASQVQWIGRIILIGTICLYYCFLDLLRHAASRRKSTYMEYMKVDNGHAKDIAKEAKPLLDLKPTFREKAASV